MTPVLAVEWLVDESGLGKRMKMPARKYGTIPFAKREENIHRREDAFMRVGESARPWKVWTLGGAVASAE